MTLRQRLSSESLGAQESHDLSCALKHAVF